MRVWDIDPKYLCHKHLLAEHRELHGLWDILTKHKAKGDYSRHPETLRWVGKAKALYNRHELLAKEFARRGHKHLTPLEKKLATGLAVQKTFINTMAEQKELLRENPCDCFMDHSLSIKYLKKVDAKLASLFGRVKPSAIHPHKRYFQSLVEAIISQQLSGKAAETISNRFKALFPKSTFPTPAQVIAKSDEELRAVGISGSKASYIKNIARAMEDKSLDFRRINKMTDEEIITMLTAIKGIGRWTAEMFLIFSLGRPDVFSFGDLGLRNAVKKLYGLSEDPTVQQLKELSTRWQPYRTTASLHLWASLNNR